VPVVSFIGPHNVGKTTLIVKVVEFLKAQGLRVGVLKSTKEPRGKTDQPGSDTFRYRAAGVDPVALWAKEEIVIYQKAQDREAAFWSFIFRHFSDCHLVIAEGFKGLAYLPKIEVARREVSQKLLLEEVPGVVALVSNFNPPVSIPIFDLEDREGLSHFILERFYRVFEPQVDLLVDGRPVGLTRYVRQALRGVITGFLQSLRDVPHPFSEVEIKLREGPRFQVES